MILRGTLWGRPLSLPDASGIPRSPSGPSHCRGNGGVRLQPSPSVASDTSRGRPGDRQTDTWTFDSTCASERSLSLSDSKGYRWCRRPKQRKSQHPTRPVPSLHPKRKHDPIHVSQPPSPPKSANPNPKSSSLVFLSRTLIEYPIRRRKCLLPSNKLVSIVPVHGCHRSPRQPPATQVRDYLGVPASEDPFGTSLNE